MEHACTNSLDILEFETCEFEVPTIQFLFNSDALEYCNFEILESWNLGKVKVGYPGLLESWKL